MSIRLSKSHMDAILDHARIEYPHECCGVVLGLALGDEKTVSDIVRVKNTHDEGHERRFLIGAEAIYHAEKDARDSGKSILGFYHSHPDHPARPSGYDREWAWPWYSYLIVNVTHGEPGDVTCWRLENEDAEFQAEPMFVE